MPIPHDWQLTGLDSSQLDITNHSAVRDKVQSLSPDLIINTAAITDVDGAEKDEMMATRINFFAVANLAAQCSSRDIPLIHISTDFVFDGEHDKPYLPDDLMNPINIYGKTKLLGEEAVRHELAWHVIIRTSSLFSACGNNIVTKALGWIDTKDELKIVDDRVICPTYAPDLARAMMTVSTALLDGKADGFGTFHFCGEPALSQYDFTAAIIDAYAPHKTKTPKLLRAKSSDFAAYAKRPLYSVMDCEKIRAIYGVEPSGWQQGVNETVAQYVQQKAIS
jgi:dTDP-4-dehydrorhamnose reductase